MFNYSRERHLFDEKWKIIKKQYQKLGMSEGTINEIYDFDLKWFCNRRTYQNRTDISDEKSINIDICADVFEHEKLSVNFDEKNFLSRYAWVETIGNKSIANVIKNLSEDYLEIVTLNIILGFSQQEIAIIKGTTKQNINNKIARFKKYFY